MKDATESGSVQEEVVILGGGLKIEDVEKEQLKEFEDVNEQMNGKDMMLNDGNSMWRY